MRTQPRFSSTDTSFKVALRRKVDAYFARTGKSRHADGRMVGKTVAFLALGAGLFGLLISGVLPALVALPLVLTLGAVIAGIGFNIGHDAVHGAYSGHPLINKVLGFSFDLLGASSYNWSRAHNQVHHTFTNVPGADHDLEPGPFLLLHPRPHPPAIYRWQHVFAFPLYAFTMIVWVFKKDFVQIFDRSMTGRGATARGAVSMVLGKLLHFALFIVLPMAVSPYAWWQVLLGYFALLASIGFILAVVFQLAHVVEGTQFPKTDAAGQIADGWAAHLMLTNYILGGGREALVSLLGLENSPAASQDAVACGCVVAADAAFIFRHDFQPIDPAKLHWDTHPPPAVRLDLMSKHLLMFASANRPELSAALTEPWWGSLMCAVSALMWRGGTNAELWDAHAELLGTDGGVAYVDALVAKLDVFRALLRQWEAEARDKPPDAPNLPGVDG